MHCCRRELATQWRDAKSTGSIMICKIGEMDCENVNSFLQSVSCAARGVDKGYE